MPRELITVQIGQCGLQVGTKFWDLALREHAAYNRSGVFDEPLSSFFRNVDARFNPPVELPIADGSGKLNPIATLKARAVLVDMEEGVLNELCRGSLGDLFDDRQLIKDVSGSGNNFAHGHFSYGPQYGPSIVEAVRHIAETCDSLQAFFLMHSLGGGTGSGLGTYILGQLEDAYPDIYRFVTCVVPSDQDDVVTSPYNSVLAAGELIKHADCVLPIHNQALIDICNRMNKPVPGMKNDPSASSASATAGTLLDSGGARASHAKRKAERAKAFDEMNTLAAQLLTSLTSGMRFEGELNVDLNEITMNLVPFPRLHFLLSSLAPLGSAHAQKYSASASSPTDPRMSSTYSSASSVGASKSIDSLFTSLFSPSNHLVKSNPKHTGVYLACGIFGRGDLSVSDINRNIQRLKKDIHMIDWNEDGFKIGLCHTPPVGCKQSLLALSNSTCIADLLTKMYENCTLLYSRKAHFHHYREYMEQEVMDEAIGLVDSVIQDYARLEGKDMDAKEKRANAAANGSSSSSSTSGVERLRPL